MKKWKIALCIVLANMMMLGITTFGVAVYRAHNILEDMKDINESRIDEYLNYKYNNPLYCSGLNGDFVNEEISQYISYAQYSKYFASYAVSYEDDNIIAEPENKLIFNCYTKTSFSKEYRIIDFDKFFSDEEVKDMKNFFESNLDKIPNNNKYIVCFGKMDDKYIYPSHIAIGDIDAELSRDKVLINKDKTSENKLYELLIYEIEKQYEYENKENLVDINMDTYLNPENVKEYIGVAGFGDYCISYDGEFEDVVTNVNKYSRYIGENGTYENNSIFTYKKIVSRQIEDSGHIITEYFSFVGKPFKQATAEAWNLCNIIIITVLINLFTFSIIYFAKKIFNEESDIKIKYKSVLGIFIINIILFVIVASGFIIDYSINTVAFMKKLSDREISNYLEDELDNFSGDPDGLYNNSEPYINGQVNSQYITESLASSIQETRYGYNTALYIMTTLDDEEIVTPDKKIYFELEKRDENGEPVESFYRIIDFEKFFSEEELENIEKFFLNNLYRVEWSEQFFCFGVMDDKYIYPTHLAIGEYGTRPNRDNVFLNTDEPNENTHCDFIVYEINKEYEYENEEALVDINSGWWDAKDFKIYTLSSDGYRRYDDGICNELGNKAKYNIEKYKNKIDENGVYENKGLFFYEKIITRQRVVQGHVITEYLSFVGKNTYNISQAIYECINIVGWMILFTIVLVICVKKWNKYKINSEIKASDLFYSVLYKMTDSVDELEKINSQIEISANKADRELLDGKIRTLDSYIKEVIEWSKMEAGALEIYPDEVEFGYLVEAVVKDISKDSRVKIETKLDMNIEAEMDLSRIAKAVAIFISHIVSKTDSSEVVYVHVKQLDQQVLFKVTNNEDEKNQDSRKYKNKVKELAEFDLLLATNYLKMHNAKHWYYNEEGKSTHIFEMPLKYKEKKNKKDEKIKGIYGVIAHEMKTPLNVIKLYNEALMSGNMPLEKKNKYNSVIATQLELIKTQVNEFIASKYLKKGIVDGQKERMNLSVVIDKVIDKYQVLLEDKQLNISIDSSEDVYIYADAIGVKSIISNYMVNAVKYSSVGSTIKICVEKNEKFAIIKIANNVPKNLRYNIEDKNQKVINRIERDGLGLIIAKTYLDICKASYGCTKADETVEYWFKFRMN